MKRHPAILLMLCIATLVHSQTTSVRAKAFLQGAYANGDTMSTMINKTGYLPLNQPYNASPWNYTGNEELDSIPSDMVDWVLLELRDNYNNSLGSRAAILLENGNIADTNLSPDITFTGIGAGSYYLLVDHRNHLPVMSGRAIATPATTTYDFSDTLNYPALGGNMAQKELEAGVFGMIAGDVNKDGIVKYSGAGNDRSLIIQRIIGETGSTGITSTAEGYFPEDLSMDGMVKYAGAGNDPTRIIQTLIGMTGSTSITTTHNTPQLIPPPPVFYCGDTLIDTRDGQKYATVKIGTQCWMAENLNVGTMVNSIHLIYGHTDMSNNGVIEKYCYNNDSTYCAEYGGLYEWDEVMEYDTNEGIQGICPAGWHLPTDSEWCSMTTFLDPFVDCNTWGFSGSNVGSKLKEQGTAHWESPNTGVNSSGFTALGAGIRNPKGQFTNLGQISIFWISTNWTSGYKISRRLVYSRDDIGRDTYGKTYGTSVRCIADNFNGQ